MEILEKLIDTFSNASLLSVLKDSKVDVSAIRLDNRNARYGFINCDNFSLQLIMQERVLRGLDESTAPSVVNDTLESSTESSTSAKVDSPPDIRNTRLGSYFYFYSADVSNSGIFKTDILDIHFVTTDTKSFSIYKNTWDIHLKNTKRSMVIKEGPLAKKVPRDSVNFENVMHQVKERLPTSSRSVGLYRNGNAYCALVRLKTGAFIDLDTSIIKFSEKGFKGVYALALFKLHHDKITLYMRDELHIVATGA